MTEKWTKGPWVLQSKALRDGKTLVLGSGRVVATLDTGSDNHDANAYLIAAAPALYTMLDRVMAEIMQTECGMSHLALLTIEQAQKALAKARGEG